MNGERTCIVLGAGASRGYTGGKTEMPLQSDLIGKLFMGITFTEGIRHEPSLIMDHGLTHSHELGVYLRSRFGLPDPTAGDQTLDYWRHLQAKGYSLESLYVELETDPEVPRWVLDDFGAVVRTAVAHPVEGGRDKVCENHRQLVEALEPGDYIVNFNWDTLAIDSLYWYSPLWFPSTGCGVQAFPICNNYQRTFQLPSLVDLFCVHGNVALFHRISEEASVDAPPFVFVQTGAYNSMSGYIEMLQHQEKYSRDEMETALHHSKYGWNRIQGSWFKPVFVPPSRAKSEYDQPYYTIMRRHIHMRLPLTRRIVIAGYSFPEADIAHLRGLFVDSVTRADTEVKVVNPQSDDPAYRERVRSVFQTAKDIDFGQHDFKTYCDRLAWRMTSGADVNTSP